MGVAIGFDEEEKKKAPDMIFTDRDKPRKKFWEVYDNLMQGEFFVINYHGFGGIGKSWLCKHLNGVLKSHQHPYTGAKLKSKSIILNYEELRNNCDKVNVLKHLVNRLESECGYKFPMFKYALYVYYRTKGASNDSPEIEKIQDNDIVNTMLDVFGMVPVVGEIGSVLLKGVDTLAANIQNQVRKNSSTIQKLDTLSLEDIATELVTIFGKEFYEHAIKEEAPIVIFMDTYEQLQNYVYQTSSAKVSEEWLWARDGLIRRIPNVLWVLAGQRAVSWGTEDSFWKDKENIHFEQLKEIDEDNVLRNLLFDLKITETEIVDTIIEKSKGVPVHLALCKDTYFNLINDGKKPMVADFDMDYPKLAKRFIGGLNLQLKDIVDVLACLESWTIEDITRMNLSADAYDYIMKLSFISFNEGFYYMHNSVQEIVYKSSSSVVIDKCLNYFIKRIEDSNITEVERKNYIYKKIKLQLRRIELLENEDEKAEKYKKLLEASMPYVRENLFDYNYFVRVKDLFQKEIPEKYMFFSYGKILSIYEFYHCILNGEYSKARHYVQNMDIMSGHTKLDEDTKALLYVSLAGVETNLKNYGLAKTYFQEAYYLWKDSSDIYAILDLLTKMSNNSIQIERYDDALKFCDEGLKKIDGLRKDSKISEAISTFIICKVKIALAGGNIKQALTYLKDAENELQDFKSDTIINTYAIIYDQYRRAYAQIGYEDKKKYYLKKSVEASKQAYEERPSDRHLKNLAISYVTIAKSSSDEMKIQKNFDMAISIFEKLYHSQCNDVAFSDWFDVIRLASECVSVDVAVTYLNKCKEMLESHKDGHVYWEKIYNYHKSIFYYNKRIYDFDKMETKLCDLERMLEDRKQQLSEADYIGHTTWIMHYKGILADSKGNSYRALECFKRENSLEYKLYMKNQPYTSGFKYCGSCRGLAYYYKELHMYSHAIQYAAEALRIKKKLLDEYASVKNMTEYANALCDIAECYESLHEKEKAQAAYEEVLVYRYKVNEQEKSISTLQEISKALDRVKKYKLEERQYRYLLEKYTELLNELENADLSEVSEELEIEIGYDCDFISCEIAILSYLLRQNLEEARLRLLEAVCPFLDFTDAIRDLYVERIEGELLAREVQLEYLTKEEALGLLCDDI